MLEDRKGVLIEHEGVPRGIENTGGKSFMDRNRHDQWHMAQQVIDPPGRYPIIYLPSN